MNSQGITKKHVVAGSIVLAVIILTVTAAVLSKVYATEEYWNLKVGDDVVAVYTSEDEAKQVVKSIKNYYVEEGATVKSITCDPELSVEMMEYRVKEPPEVTTDSKELIEYLVTGTKERVTYKVKDGDTLWDIADKFDFTVDEIAEMNESLDIDELYPGDVINLYEMKPVVNITTVQEKTYTKEISYKSVTRKSSKILKGNTKVKQYGENGKKKVTSDFTSVNGKVTDEKVLKSKVTKKPKKEIILKGTKVAPAPVAAAAPEAGTADTGSASADYDDSATYSGNGADIANFALQFVGNPYVYGGSSLTNGADCSGFVMTVFQHYGISMAHDASVMAGYGRAVSESEAQPGDLVCYGYHVGIYIGGGQLVHAMNEENGITVSSLGYSGNSYTIRRVVE